MPDDLQDTILQHADRLLEYRLMREKAVNLVDARSRLRDPNTMDVGYYGYLEEDEYGQEAEETEVGAVAEDPRPDAVEEDRRRGRDAGRGPRVRHRLRRGCRPARARPVKICNRFQVLEEPLEVSNGGLESEVHVETVENKPLREGHFRQRCCGVGAACGDAAGRGDGRGGDQAEGRSLRRRERREGGEPRGGGCGSGGTPPRGSTPSRSR